MKKLIILLFMLLVSITTSNASELELSHSQLGIVKSVTYVVTVEAVQGNAVKGADQLTYIQ